MSEATLFEVQTFTLCDDWINCWTISDHHGERPETFTTREDAQAEIDHLLKEIQFHTEAGDLDPSNDNDPDGYRIVKISADTYRKEVE